MAPSICIVLFVPFAAALCNLLGVQQRNVASRHWAQNRRRYHRHCLCMTATQTQPGLASRLVAEEAPATEIGSDDVVLIIGNARLNVTSYVREHPGGAAVLRKYHGKNATRAFEAARHSPQAYELVRRWTADSMPVESRGASLWAKLFTHEDRSQVHKVLGIFCLGHYLWRLAQGFLTDDASAGFASLAGFGAAALVAHAALSLSSFKFHVPRERVAKKPMIWQEFRMHNTVFALRSFVCCAIAACAVNASPTFRPIYVAGSAIAVLASLVVADFATSHLRHNSTESTTATMPYWEGATAATERRFKTFYAWCQFLATLGCLTAVNPFWPFIIALPIQLASLLMTLVRKSILSTRGYHYIYTAALCVPFLVGLRGVQAHPEFLAVVPLGTALLYLRRRGVSKYALWTSVASARVAISFLATIPPPS